MVTVMVVEDVKVCCAVTLPASPQSIMVLEKAIKQNGHLGSNASKMPDNKLICFLGSAVVCFLLQGLQSFCTLEVPGIIPNL